MDRACDVGQLGVAVQCRGVGPLLADNYVGTYLVLEKGPKVFKLQLGERTEVVSRDRLKPHAGKRHLWTLSRHAGGGHPREGTRSSSRLCKICRE